MTPRLIRRLMTSLRLRAAYRRFERDRKVLLDEQVDAGKRMYWRGEPCPEVMPYRDCDSVEWQDMAEEQNMRHNGWLMAEQAKEKQT